MTDVPPQMLLDYDDLMKIPFYDILDRMLNEDGVKLRTDSTGELKYQRIHPVVAAPKIPGRFYFIFGKPIETRGTSLKNYASKSPINIPVARTVS
jgi:hypothetical protein